MSRMMDRVMASAGAAALALAFLLAGCDDPVQPDVIASVTVSGATAVPVGGQARLAATVRGTSGAILRDATVSWTSLDAGVATVSGAGVVTGVGPGTAKITARSGPASDTARITVPAPDLEPGALRGNLTSGAGGAPIAWSGTFTLRDRLASDEDAGLIMVENGRGVGSDTSLVVILPGTVRAGAYDIAEFPRDGSATDRPVAYLRIAGGARTYYGVAGGRVTIAAVALPERPGLWFGEVRGTIEFQAVRRTGGPGGPEHPDDTLAVAAEFRLRLQHLLVANVSVSLTAGGPVHGTALTTNAQTASDDAGGILVWWDAGFGSRPWAPDQISHEFRLGAPATGTFPVAAIDPDTYTSPALWPRAFSALYFREDPRRGFSRDGTLVITEHTPPTSAYYGSIRGRLTTGLALWLPAGPTGTVVEAEVEFAVPIWPLAGVPTAAVTEPATAAVEPPIGAAEPTGPATATGGSGGGARGTGAGRGTERRAARGRAVRRRYAVLHPDRSIDASPRKRSVASTRRSSAEHACRAVLGSA